ncbi:hypothetical protein ZHAS_00000910 [Anopheles sinensis]|uniref:Uncharacterized protein n=1 Tax=Anopheles sinensis TaxID=74873 RepID=A0A084VAS6_ANOSI|nr:hypothetical protein ZHAS_00000910 [Anopheles sinensis]
MVFSIQMLLEYTPLNWQRSVLKDLEKFMDPTKKQLFEDNQQRLNRKRETAQ